VPDGNNRSGNETKCKMKSKRYKVRRTAWDALVAYCGSRRVEVFGGAWDAQQWIEARRAEGHSVDVEGVYS